MAAEEEMAFISGEPSPTVATAEEEVAENCGGEEEEDEMGLGLCLGSKKQQQQPSPVASAVPDPGGHSARDLQPGPVSRFLHVVLLPCGRCNEERVWIQARARGQAARHDAGDHAGELCSWRKFREGGRPAGAMLWIMVEQCS